MGAGSDWAAALHGSGAAAAMRESMWLYPFTETVHIIGLAVLVGAVILFDLRVLGLSPRLSVRLLARHLLPWALAALLLIVPSGLLMFSADAIALSQNRAFLVKLLLLALAAANAAAFHLGLFRRVERWERDARAPLGARLHAGASILIWIGVISCGRMIAYV
jgi:hypothetical protein